MIILAAVTVALLFWRVIYLAGEIYEEPRRILQAERERIRLNDSTLEQINLDPSATRR